MMTRLAAAFLLLAGAAPGNGPRPVDPADVHAHDFATPAMADAQRLEGKPTLFRVTLDTDTEPEERDGLTCADCEGSGDPLRTVYLHPGQEVVDVMTVEATLRILCYPAVTGADGSWRP